MISEVNMGPLLYKVWRLVVKLSSEVQLGCMDLVVRVIVLSYLRSIVFEEPFVLSNKRASVWPITSVRQGFDV